jgi:hypothetical protein
VSLTGKQACQRKPRPIPCFPASPIAFTRAFTVCTSKPYVYMDTFRVSDLVQLPRESERARVASCDELSHTPVRTPQPAAQTVSK